jgi:hypothetical protein
LRNVGSSSCASAKIYHKERDCPPRRHVLQLQSVCYCPNLWRRSQLTIARSKGNRKKEIDEISGIFLKYTAISLLVWHSFQIFSGWQNRVTGGLDDSHCCATPSEFCRHFITLVQSVDHILQRWWNMGTVSSVYLQACDSHRWSRLW